METFCLIKHQKHGPSSFLGLLKPNLTLEVLISRRQTMLRKSNVIKILGSDLNLTTSKTFRK